MKKRTIPFFSMLKKLVMLDFWPALLFWAWNIVFICFMLFGFAPNVLPNLLQAIRTNSIPPAFPLLGLTLTAIPVVAVVVGFVFLRKQPRRLFALGYGVEWPLMLLIAIRLFLFREVVPSVAYLLGAIAIAMLGFCWMLFDQREKPRSSVTTGARLIVLTIAMLIATYMMVWFGFYFVPIVESILDLFGMAWTGIVYLFTNLGEVVTDFFKWLIALPANFFRGVVDFWESASLMDWQFIIAIPFIFFGMILWGFTATLLIGLPLAVMVLYWRTWRRAIYDAMVKFGRIPTYSIAALTAVLFIAGFFISNRQPQQRAFDLLENTPSSFADAQQLLSEDNAIREGLVNAYLAPRRYLSANGEVFHLTSLYEEVFIWAEPSNRSQYGSWNGESYTQRQERAADFRRQMDPVVAAYETLAQPILYRPAQPQPDPETQTPEQRWNNNTLQNESNNAAQLYADYFDQPILEAERARIVRAAQSNWNVTQATADWQLVDDREVHLETQQVTVTENGAWAEVELYEVYSNRTMEQQEVLYYFSLPESAVVTSVSLSEEGDKETAFKHRVSPRGAAQQVFQEQVRVRQDPALVEQLGPTQYRLRVFPVAPMWMDWSSSSRTSTLMPGRSQHLWLSYRVMVPEGEIALPQLSVLRNVFWDDETERTLNGVPFVLEEGVWLPDSVEARTPAEKLTRWQRVDFANNQSVLLRAATDADVPTLQPDTRLAVVVDRSRSMEPHQRDVATALDQLRGAGAIGVSVDVYLTSAEIRGEAASRTTLEQVNGEDIVYFGGMNSAELLQQYDALKADSEYDAIIVLTDSSGYELGAPESAVPRPDAAVWMVHIGGYPIGYDDDSLASIQSSGGGSVLSLTDALDRIAVGQQQDRVGFDLVDGYVWQTMSTDEASQFGDAELADSLAPIAARRLILSDMIRQRNNLDALESLDSLHAIAVENSIVTPYSSMIVLVNAQQERRLDQLEAQADRFEREFEEVGVPTSFGPLAAVPEPHEYLLMALAGLMLIWYLRNQRMLKQQSA